MSSELVGVDPDDRVTVKVGGAEFELSPIPSGIWERLNAERKLLLQDSRRFAIKRLTEMGVEDLNAPAGDNFKFTKLDYACGLEPNYVQGVTALYLQAASYAVRGHKNFVNKARNPFPFDTEKVTVDGAVVDRMTEATQRIYRANVVVLQAVWLKIYELNNLGEQEKKV